MHQHTAYDDAAMTNIYFQYATPIYISRQQHAPSPIA